jgi:hypothetical protein
VSPICLGGRLFSCVLEKRFLLAYKKQCLFKVNPGNGYLITAPLKAIPQKSGIAPTTEVVGTLDSAAKRKQADRSAMLRSKKQ